MAYSNTAEQLEVASSVSVSDEFQILTDIYNEHVNIAIWQHTLSSDIFASKKTLQYKIILHFATRNVEKLHIAAIWVKNVLS